MTTQIDIVPPPRASGNPVSDAFIIGRWLHDFYEAAIIQGGLIGNAQLSSELETQFPILFDFGMLEGTAADKLAYFSAENDLSLTDFSATAQLLLAKTSTADMLTFLGASSFSTEDVQDIVAGLILNGTGLTWTYDDGANTLTGNVSLASFTTADLAEGANLYFTNERVDDRVAVLIQNGTGISWTYNDPANTLTPAVSLASFTTANLAEGANLYFTTARVQAAACYASYANTTQTGNTAATETDAFSHTVAANSLSANGQSLNFEAAGTFAATASVDKRIKVKFGGTTVFDSGAIAVTAANSWTLRGRIIRTGASAQKILVDFASSFATFNSSAAYTLGAIDLTVGQTMKLTLNGTNANDTVGEMYYEELTPTP